MAKREEEIKKQSYLRLLKYAVPYKRKLFIGIVASFVAGGSLFGSMLMIPQLMKGIEYKSAASIDLKTRQAAEKLVEAVEAAGPDSDARVAAVAKALSPAKEGDKIAQEVAKWKTKLAGLGVDWLKLDYEDGSIKAGVSSFEFSLPAEDKAGRMTWQFFSLFVLCFLFLWAFKNVASYINRYYTRWVGTKVINDLRAEAFRKLINQSLQFYGRMDVGQLISRCTNDTAAIEASVANAIADIILCPVQILACVAAIVYASFQYQNLALTAMLFIGLPLCVVPFAIISRKVRKIYKKSFSQIAEVVTRMHEVFTSILIVKAYNAEGREIARFDEVNRKYFKTVIKALKTQLLMGPLMEVVAVTATLVFFLYSYNKGVTLTELAQLLVPCFMAYGPIKELAKISSYIQRSMAAADRYFHMIDIDTGIKEAANPKPLKSFEKAIEFKDVVFAYDKKKILDGISLTIPKGHVVAVVGPTGSGKTTIANLIARFYDVNSGSVMIDGLDVREVSTSDLRDLIGIITQDALLFNDAVGRNIAYGCPDASQERIEEAAKQARAHDFIVDGRHPDGYQTVIGEKGNKLSGGEKQRVSIARAILKNPPILILDEATSALDTVTEQQVQDALNRVMKNRTVFAIAHRLSTIKNANTILVLDKGRVVEAGTHDELMALGGRYKKLHDTQFGAKKSENGAEAENGDAEEAEGEAKAEQAI